MVRLVPSLLGPWAIQATAPWRQRMGLVRELAGARNPHHGPRSSDLTGLLGTKSGPMADQLIPPLSLASAERAGPSRHPLAAFVRMLADAVNGQPAWSKPALLIPRALTIAGVASNASITVSAHTRQYASLAKRCRPGR